MRHISITLACVGGVMAVVAVRTPELALDRGTVVLGENANGVGFLCALGALSSILLMRRGVHLSSILATVLATTCITGVVVSESRGSLLAVVTGLIVLLLSPLLRGRQDRAFATAALLLIAVVVSVGPLTEWFVRLVGRSQDGAEASTEARQELVIYALQVGADHPLTGVGLGGLANYSRLDSSSGLAYRAHNVFAGVWAETGALPLILLVTLCAVAVLRSRLHKNADMLALVVCVIISGIALEWWGGTRTGPLALLILGSAISVSPVKTTVFSLPAAAERSVRDAVRN
jgi:O-antigen ligase